MHRDLILGLVAGICAVALAVTAWVQPPASEQITLGLVAIGSQAIGRFSGANGELGK
ncbi:MAG: hypothetical protein IPG97_13300 [Microthrixaceae bacterium]|jgi:hypothetical protein|nr:hypothetical protein [Microthrixaceae bacterium]